MKTKEDNNVIDCTDVVYAKNDVELLWPIRPSADYDEKQIGQLRDWSYRCRLCQKQNRATMTDQIGSDMWQKVDRTTMWLIV